MQVLGFFSASLPSIADSSSKPSWINLVEYISDKNGSSSTIKIFDMPMLLKFMSGVQR